MADQTKFTHLSISGGPEPQTLKVFRDGKEVNGLLEFQINGSVDNPVTAIFKEIVVFDGSIDVMSQRKTGLDTH